MVCAFLISQISYQVSKSYWIQKILRKSIKIAQNDFFTIGLHKNFKVKGQFDLNNIGMGDLIGEFNTLGPKAQGPTRLEYILKK